MFTPKAEESWHAKGRSCAWARSCGAARGPRIKTPTASRAHFAGCVGVGSEGTVVSANDVMCVAIAGPPANHAGRLLCARREVVTDAAAVVHDHCETGG